MGAPLLGIELSPRKPLTVMAEILLVEHEEVIAFALAQRLPTLGS